MSQLIRYSRACGSYQEFLDRGLLLTRKILKHGFSVKLKSSLVEQVLLSHSQHMSSSRFLAGTVLLNL
jgi:hypothetical protein